MQIWSNEVKSGDSDNLEARAGSLLLENTVCTP